MTLPATPPLLLTQVNVEIQRSANNPLMLSDSAVRTLAGNSGGAYMMSSLLGKSYWLTTPTYTTITDEAIDTWTLYFSSNLPAVWNTSITSSGGAGTTTQSAANGTSATSFSVTMAVSNRFSTRRWGGTVTATYGGQTRTWSIDVFVYGSESGV